MKPEQISPELLTALQNASRNLETVQAVRQFLVNEIFQQYKLKQGDTVCGETGKITYATNGQAPMEG